MDSPSVGASYTSSQIGVTILLGILAAVVAVMSIVEYRRWQRGHSLISGRQLFIRLLAGGLLLAVLAKVMHGVLHVLPGMQSGRFVLVYWTDCVVLGWLTLLVVVIDVRLVLKYRRQQRQYLGQMTHRLASSLHGDGVHPDSAGDR